MYNITIVLPTNKLLKTCQPIRFFKAKINEFNRETLVKMHVVHKFSFWTGKFVVKDDRQCPTKIYLLIIQINGQLVLLMIY